VLAAATATDAANSWGRAERNPVLRGPDGRFGTRAVALKAGLAGGLALTQYVIVRKHSVGGAPFAVVNFAAAGVLSGAAAYNCQASVVADLSPEVYPSAWGGGADSGQRRPSAGQHGAEN
jgi:hypothetical protein